MTFQTMTHQASSSIQTSIAPTLAAGMRYPMAETEAIQAAQAGSLSAFNHLVMCYQGLLFNLAYRILNNQDLAADATQDALIKAFKSINQYKGGSFKNWLMRIVTNTCYDMLRYQQRHPTEPLENTEPQKDQDYSTYWQDLSEQPEEQIIRQELNRILQNAISRLPSDQRVTLVLCDVEGFDYQEIAAITGTNVGTVKSRLSRARHKLKSILQTKGGFSSSSRMKDLAN